MEPKMYNISSIENGWADLARIFFFMYTIYRDNTHEWLTKRANSAAKNVDVNELNLKIQHLSPGDLVSYKSIDTVFDATEAVNYPTYSF
jgi:hypothetical protein